MAADLLQQLTDSLGSTYAVEREPGAGGMSRVFRVFRVFLAEDKALPLRARIASGPLPFPETIGMLADVAKALAYAQSEGVVHRDIKPDDILLSGGAATVADFGIAKALSSARQVGDGETLTSLAAPAYRC